MNIDIEEKIIKEYFNKRCRDRILYELQSEKKRKNFFDKIAHNCESYIDCRFITQKSEKLIDPEVIRKALCKTNNICYVIVRDSRIDGNFVDFDSAMNELWGKGSPYLIYSIEDGSVYLEAEYDFSIHPSYILSK